MFYAMNRFRIRRGYEDEFEKAWKERDTHLTETPGFVEFHLLRGPETDEHTLYVSHTLWASVGDFEAWTNSEAFRAAHASAGQRRHLYIGGPQFEGFDVVQHIK